MFTAIVTYGPCPFRAGFSEGGNVIITINIKDYMLRPCRTPRSPWTASTSAIPAPTAWLSHPTSRPEPITSPRQRRASRSAPPRESSSTGRKSNVQLNRESAVTDPNTVTFIVLDSGTSQSKLAGAAIYINGTEIGKTDTRDGKVQYPVPRASTG